jgi:ABC-type dipeptide/oligopeptide/nickel transport system ATPase component
MMDETPMLELRGMRIVFRQNGGEVVAVRDASIEVWRGESVGIVGESGSGKSTLARAVVGLLAGGAAPIEAGEIVVDGRVIPHTALQTLRGATIAMVFQDPLSYLNPLMPIGRQIGESVRRHDPSAHARTRIAELLDLVRLPPACRLSYPHELSGGMRQRVLLAIALGCRPQLLIADEPTTALDVTTQAEILDLIRNVKAELNMALILISHDLGVVSTMCERLYVMYRGRIVERGALRDIFAAPRHPYTVGLLNADRAVRDEAGRFVTLAGVDPDTLDILIDAVEPVRPERAADGSRHA